MDKHLISLMEKQGLDKNRFELLNDYSPRSRGKEHSPYARFYRDKLSNTRIMVAGILPGVTNAGFFIVPQFRRMGSKFVSEENCFEAEVDKGTVRVTCINDQPNGRKKLDQAIWHPQVYLGGVEQRCGKPIWLETDHMNPNYHFNVIEWNFGFCKRRIRIIEGRFRDRITLASNPNAEVRVANNATGNMRLRFGSRDADGSRIGIVQGDVEIISKEELAKASYPITIGASPETFYPDADAETSSVDGACEHRETNLSWAELEASVGTHAYPSDVAVYIQIASQTTPGSYWRKLIRGFILFDTSGLPDGCSISAATLSLYGYGKLDDCSITPTANIYASNPASNTDLIAGDFDAVSSTAFCDTAITYAGWNTSGYNDFAFNATGIAAVSKTGVSKFSMREGQYDAGAGTPTHPGAAATKNTYMLAYSAERGNTAEDPKLVVTYTVGWANIASLRQGTGEVASADIAKIRMGTGSIAVADIAKIGGVAV